MIMIPKLIHYCWFSGEEMPPEYQRCIDSWKKYLPEYELRCWTFDDVKKLLDSVPLMREAYQIRKWAFMADYVRVYALYHFGGIYLDADVEVFGSFDKCLENEFFIGTEHLHVFYKNNVEHIRPECAIMGGIAGHPLLKDLLDFYDTLHLFKSFGRYSVTPAPAHYLKIMQQYGYLPEDRDQHLKSGIQVYSSETFTNTDYPTASPLAVHLFENSWHDKGMFYNLCCKLKRPGIYRMWIRLKAWFRK